MFRGVVIYLHIIMKHIQPTLRYSIKLHCFTEQLALKLHTFQNRNYDIVIGGYLNIYLLKIKSNILLANTLIC